MNGTQPEKMPTTIIPKDSQTGLIAEVYASQTKTKFVCGSMSCASIQPYCFLSYLFNSLCSVHHDNVWQLIVLGGHEMQLIHLSGKWACDMLQHFAQYTLSQTKKISPVRDWQSTPLEWRFSKGAFTLILRSSQLTFHLESLTLPAPTVNGRGDRPWKVQFTELQKPRDLDLDHGIPSCISHRPLSTYQISLKSEKLFVNGWTYASTDGHFRPPLMLLGRIGGVDLKTRCLIFDHNYGKCGQIFTIFCNFRFPIKFYVCPL